MTTSGPSGEQGGEHGGAMDKLKSVWREAVGSRDDDESGPEGRADARGARQAPGSAHPADVRPEVTARNASGMQPADDGTGPLTQQPPQPGQPQRARQPGQGPVPQQQQPAPVRHDQTVTAASRVPAAQGAPGWRSGQAPPNGAADERTQQQVPRQSAPPPRPAQPAVPQQAAPQAGEPDADPDATQLTPAAATPAAQQQTQQGTGAQPQTRAETAERSGKAVWSEPGRTDAAATADRRPEEKPADRTGGTADAPTRQPAGAGDPVDATTDTAGDAAATDTGTDKPRGRHELFDANRGSGPASGTASGTASGAAVGAGVAGAATGAAANAGDRTAENGTAPSGTATASGQDAASARPAESGEREPATTGGAATSAAPTAASTAAASTEPAGTGATREGVPDDPDRFIPADRSEGYAARWSEVKGDFVDEPRDAVRKADALVGEVLDEIARVFTEQRSQLEHGLDTDGTSTEDLRQAMQRYRKFFERLLTI